MIGIYAGTFDPITFGHIDIIKRSASKFTKVYVCLSDNWRKKTFFPLVKREALLKEVLKELNLPNVYFIKETEKAIFRKAVEINADVLIRAIRTTSDIENELLLAKNNMQVCPQLETFFMIARNDLLHISSSYCWELIFLKENISNLVPANVEEAMKKYSLKKGNENVC